MTRVARDERYHSDGRHDDTVSGGVVLMQRSGNAAWLWLSKCGIDWAPSEDADADADAPKTLVTM
jgi:hypothetical protein